MEKSLSSIREHLYWRYATLGMAMDARKRGIDKYDRTSFSIRNALFRDLMSGEKKPQSFYNDERYKMLNAGKCVYCGSSDAVSVDHVLPRAKGVDDNPANLVFCCKRCNSSKGAKDMIQWQLQTGEFPPLYMIQRYFKLVIAYCEENGLMDKSIEEIRYDSLPFSLQSLTVVFPHPIGFNKLDKDTQ